MSQNSNSQEKQFPVLAFGTVIAAIAGTTFAAPVAIGAGVCLAIWGGLNLKKKP